MTTNSFVSLFSLILSLFGAASFAEGSEHRYVAWNPGASLSDCEAKLSTLQQTFSALTGLTVDEASCGSASSIKLGREELSFRPMALIYRRPQGPVSLYAVQFGSETSRNQTGAQYGSFETLSQCQSQLPSLAALTEKETGLPVLTAYCLKHQATFSSTSGMFYLQVDTVVDNVASKTLKKRLHTQAISQSSILSYIPETLSRDVSDRLKKAGATVAHQIAGTFWYFSAQPLPFTVWPVFGVTNDGACEKQRARFQSLLSQLGGTAQPSFHCVERTATSKNFQNGVGIWMGRRTVGLAAIERERYTSLEDCLKDLPRLDRNLPQYETFKKTIGYVCVSSMTSLDSLAEYDARGVETF